MMLLLNVLKEIKEKKLQTIIIILFLFLSTGIYTSINLALDVLENQYYQYLKKQNVEDISVGFSSSIEKTLKRLSSQNHFDYEVKLSKEIKEKNYYYKILPYQKNIRINKPYLLKGRFPQHKDEMTMLPQFARKHGIQLGDLYSIDKKEYKVVGFAYASDYIYPLFHLALPFYEEEKENIIYVTPWEYQMIKGEEEISYSIDYQEKVPRAFAVKINDKGEIEEGEGSLKIFSLKGIPFTLNTLERMTRIGKLQLEFATNRLLASFLLFLLLFLSSCFLFMATKHQLQRERRQIGILKALGYSSSFILISYFVYPILCVGIGGILGYYFGTFLSPFLIKIFVGSYLLPLPSTFHNLVYLKICLFFPFVFLSFSQFFLTLFVIHKKVIFLLQPEKHIKKTFSYLHRFFSIFPFSFRFRIIFTIRSLGKIGLISIFSFLSSLFIIFILVGIDLFDILLKQTFSASYQNIVYFNQIETKRYSSRDDYILSLDTTFHGNTITVLGIDVINHYSRLKDDKNKDITEKLEEKNSIIINRLIKQKYSLKQGDFLSLTIGGEKKYYHIVGITKDMVGSYIYRKREYVNEDINLVGGYNQIRTNDNSYDRLNSISQTYHICDIKTNFKKEIDRFRLFLSFIMICFFSLFFFLLLFITNIIVEENKKLICLMKVFGYSDKKIEKMVLRIYIPFLLISYFLAIPCMIFLIKKGLHFLAQKMNFSFLITLSWQKILIGLLLIFIIYFSVLFLSKKIFSNMILLKGE